MVHTSRATYASDGAIFLGDTHEDEHGVRSGVVIGQCFPCPACWMGEADAILLTHGWERVGDWSEVVDHNWRAPVRQVQHDEAGRPVTG